VAADGDPYDLERFVRAQDEGGTFRRTLDELHAGRKRSHWMWFVFPQIAGLGSSPMAQRYAIASLDEAWAYLDHDVLVPRLLDCATAVAAWTDRSPHDPLASDIDDRKLQSSMTLFHQADPDQAVFRRVLDVHFDGESDAATLDRL